MRVRSRLCTYVHICNRNLKYLYFLVYCRNVPHSCSKEMTSSLGNDIHKISLKMTEEFFLRTQNRRSKHKARVREILNCSMENANVTFEKIRSNSVEQKYLVSFQFSYFILFNSSVEESKKKFLRLSVSEFLFQFIIFYQIFKIE